MPRKDTILVADDDRVFVTMVSESLRKKGYNVMVAFDAVQALMRVRQATPNAVVLDVNMPGGTGIETLKKIRMMNASANIPVIVVTSLTDPKLPDEVRTLGADEFLTKPVDLERLSAVLLAALGHEEKPA